MSVLDDVISFLGLGPDSWDERLLKSIDFISPDGDEFSAKWRGSPRSFDKKLGIFLYPKIKGNVVQDLDVNSDRYSLQFFFDGKDSDKKAQSFFKAAKQNGTWNVTHPVHGFVDLQLMSITELDSPIDSGGIVEFSSEWIEPIDPELLKTAKELAGLIDGQGDALNLAALEDFANQVKQGTEQLTDAISKTTQAIGNLSDKLLSPLAAITDSIDSIFNAVQNGINDTLNSTVLAVESLGGQVQALIQTPPLASNSLGSRLDTYSQFTSGTLDLLPGGSESKRPLGAKTKAANNEIATTELASSATLKALADIAITSPTKPVATDTIDATTGVTTSDFIETKAQAIAAAETISGLFSDITASLETAQDAFSDVPLDDQYFSQKTSFTEASILIGLVVQYLQVVSYDLAIEKRFILKRPRCPIDIVISEYGELGDNDANLDLFIRTNQLKGEEILLLPAGREVVVYA